MANVKITQLPTATTPLTGTEVFPLVQGTTTKQVAITGLFTSPVMTNPTLGTVGQADLINATGLPIASGVSGLGAGIATFLGTPSSANLRTAVTDETGTGSLVFATSPTLVTPDLGTPSVLVATNATGTAVGLTAGSAITNANLTGAVTSVGNATSLGSFTSAQLRTALTDETGAGSAVFATSPTITAPILNQINDTNNAQILGLSPTTSAVDYLVVKNGIGVGVPLHFYADGSSANIGLHLQPKGTGLITISDGTDFNKGIRFRSSSSAASAITLLDAVSTAGRVVTLPDATTTLVGRDTTDTLTNKTIAFSSNTFSGTLAIANGGTGQATANAALNALLPSQTGNASKYLQTDGSNSSWDAISLSTADITGTLGTANGGTGLGGATPFTSGGVVYASSTSALATGSALTFTGTNLGIGIATAGYTVHAVNANASVTVTSADATSEMRINAQSGVAILETITNTPLRFRINSTEQMRLTTTGLGIGTTSPTQKLQVVGNVAVNDGSWFGFGDVDERIVGNNTGFMQFFANGVEQMRLSSANLGIGTTSPQARLAVSNSGANGFEFDPNNAFISSYNRSTSAFTAVKFRALSYIWNLNNSNDALSLDSSGNLGIGTTSPATKLDVTNGYATDNNVSLTLTNSQGAATDNGAIAYRTSTGAGFMTSAQINSGPGSGYNASYFKIRVADSSQNLQERLRIDVSGNVGIGTSSPTTKLHLAQSSAGNYASVILLSNTAADAGDKSGIYGSTSVGNASPYRGGITFHPGDFGKLTFHTGNNATPAAGQVMELNSAGNLGLGVTPSAWGSIIKPIEFANSAYIGGQTNSTAALYAGANAYYNGTNWIYKTSTLATNYISSDGKHIWYNAASGTAGNTITFTQAMTLDADGDLGIGETSPAVKLHVKTSAGTIALFNSTNASGPYATFQSSGTSFGDIGSLKGISGTGNATDMAINGRTASGIIAFCINDAEKARINNSGNFLINTTSVFSNAKLTVSSTATDGIACTQGTTGGYCFLSNALTNGGTFYHASFGENGTQRGSITSNGTVTVYNTTSDYRLKNNQAPLTGSGAFIDALQPKTWNWAQDGSKGVGFIAHEFAEVSPSSVTGAKDAIDAEGNPVHQVMQASSAEVIANLVAEIQSLRKRLADAGI